MPSFDLMPAFFSPSALGMIRSPGPIPKQTDWAYALAGGGAKGAFQMGAEQCLFRDIRYRPVGIASTSVGSVNATAIAENSPEGLDKLSTTWLSLTSVHDMYQAEDWIHTVDGLDTFHGTLGIHLYDELLGAAPRTLEAFNPNPDHVADDSVDDALRSVLSWIPTPGVIPATSILGAPVLAPVMATAWPLLPFLVDSVGEIVSSILNDVRRVEQLLRDQAQGLFNFRPLSALLTANADFAAIQRAGTRLRIVMTALEDGCLYAMDEHLEYIRYSWNQQWLRTEAVPSPVQHHSGTPNDRLVVAVLASSSLPLINVPIEIGDRASPVATTPLPRGPLHMVDGGLRDTLPVKEALETAIPRPGRQAGVLAIGTGAVHPSRDAVTMPELQKPGVSLDRFVMATVGSIAFETLVDEVYLSDLQQLVALPDDVDRLAIMPANTVGETSDIDPGMVQILIAYGWMRAYDVMRHRELGLSDEDFISRLWANTEAITQARVAAWTLERVGISFRHEWPGLPLPRHVAGIEEYPAGWHFPTEKKVGEMVFSRDGNDLVERIRFHKRTIRDLVTQRIARNGLDSVPSLHELSNFAVGNVNCFGDWYSAWERHGLSAGRMTFPTGPGLQSPRDDSLEVFGRHSSPWLLQHRFTTHLFASGHGRLPRDRINKVDPASTEFFDTPAEAIEPSWFHRAGGYRVVRHEGYCFPVLGAPPPSGTVPLVLLTGRGATPAIRSHLTTSRATVAGFGAPVRLGAVFDPGRPQPSGTVPLLTYRSESLNDYLTTADYTRCVEGNPLEHGGWRARDRILPDYVLEHVEGFVYPPRHTATDLAPLYRWMRDKAPDSFTTSQPDFIPLIDGRAVSN